MSYQYHAGRKSGTYFQVPLSAFAYGSNDKERLNAIISFGLVEAGEKWWRRATEDKRQERLAAWGAVKPVADFNHSQTRHLYAVRGAEITKVTIGSARGCLAEHDALNSFCQPFVASHGADPMVRLKTGFVFEARDGKGVSARELSVLAAIYSIIGNKQGPVLITQARIRCRALGYKSVGVMQIEFPKRKDAACPLTDWQLRSLLEKLTARKFYARSTYGCRQTYYSHRMPLGALRKAIIERKTFMFANKLINRQDDQAMTDAIQNQRAGMAGRAPAAPDARPVPVRGNPSPEYLE
jgi:hypothetical protein